MPNLPTAPYLSTAEPLDEFMQFILGQVSVTNGTITSIGNGLGMVQDYLGPNVDVHAIQTPEDLLDLMGTMRSLLHEELKSTLEIAYWSVFDRETQENMVKVLGYVPEPIDFLG